MTEDQKVEFSTLVVSDNPGRFALDSPDGRDLTSGQMIRLKIGKSWYPGRIEADQQGYFFLSPEHKLYLRTGMQVKLA